MSVNEIIGLAAGIIMIASLFPYVKAILAGIVHPHLFSWLVWSILMGIGFVAQISEGAGPGAWTTGINCILCLGVAALCLKYGEKHITRGDWIAFIAALSAIPLWIATDNPLGAVLLATIIDCVAFVPTWRKSWIRPREEEMSPYVASAIAFSMSLAVMQEVNFVTSFYPAILVLMNFGFVMMVFVRRKTIPVA